MTVSVRGGAALVLLLLAAAVAPPAAAQDSGVDCMVCHASRDLSRSDGKGGSLQVDPAVLARSPHARLACGACHAGAQGMPHPARLAEVRCESCHASQARAMAGVHASAASCKSCHGTHDVRPAAAMGPASCATCHANETRDYDGSVHGVALAKGDTDASKCRDCHGPAHAARAHTDSLSTVSHGRLAETCGRCHADRALMTRRQITIPQAYTLYKESIHGRSDKPNAATCNDCHESHRLKPASDPASSIHRANIPATCARCHPQQAADYSHSVHGAAMERGVRAAPVCTDCHGEHRIRGPHDPDSPVASTGVTQTCAHCHEAASIRETFGLPAGRLSTWKDSFHGLAARGGSPAVANCASCHGDHLILPSRDPRSAVHPANLPATCGACHPGAGERFASGLVHVAMDSPDRPVLRWVRLGYLWLIALTIGGMIVHQTLDFRMKLRRRLAEHLGLITPHVSAVTRWYLRMTVSERVQHALLAVSFFTLVYTGFALKFPETWLFSWLARLEGGAEWRGLIHRWAAVVMVATAVFHVGYLFTRRGRGTVMALLPRPADAREALDNVLHLIGLRRTPPAFDRFSYIEKAEYWALVWGTAVMTVTGVALWFEEEALRFVNKWALDLATLVHYYEAWLAFLAIMIWHGYQVVMNPDAYPMNWTWLTGRISEEQLRHEHGAEWARMQADDRAAREAAENAEDEPEPPAAGGMAGSPTAPVPGAPPTAHSSPPGPPQS